MPKTLSDTRIGRRLRFRDLQVFFAVAECGGMAKGAAQLGVTQPAVSEIIAGIESAFAVRLFDRTPHGVELTIYGRALLKRGLAAFDELKQGMRDIEFLADPTVGEVRIGCPESIAGALLPPLVRQFCLEYPRIAYGVTAKDYEANLEANLVDLLERIKSGRYVAPPVRRVYIPKADGSARPLGIPSFEDKVAQRAIVMVLEPLYEQDFLPCSFGFRPGRSAHQALTALSSALMGWRGLSWVLDVDISKYYDTIQHHHLRAFLDRRVTDGVIRRMIDKWLKAGVLEHGRLRHSTEGTPQGGVISPLLANIYLHHVLDEWFEQDVRPRLKGDSILVRYADDCALTVSTIEEAKRVLGVLGKRLGRFGLTLHPTKTRLVDFRYHRPGGTSHPETDCTTFDFLGFTHVWGKSWQGKTRVWQVTAKSRYARALAAVSEWCRHNRHLSLRDQHSHLSRMMRGHYAYYGISGNYRRIRWFAWQVVRVWRKWLSRRDRQGVFEWTRLNELLKRHPLPPARIVHRYGATASEALP